MKMFSYFLLNSVIDTVILLRTITLAVKIILIFIVNFVLEYNIPWLPVAIIIGAEVLFNLACFIHRKHPLIAQQVNLLIQLLIDVVFLACLLHFSGGATNAFVSLLLIPIAIAAVTLNYKPLAIVTASAVGAYSILLWLMPMHVMHGNMQGHFIGMWINFIFSAAVVSFVIAHMAKSITDRELKLTKIKEQQIKQEKVMALAIASAQVTHDLATPLATIQLLTDEIAEEHKDIETLQELNAQIQRCCDSLHQFRDTTLSIEDSTKHKVQCKTLMAQIQQHCTIYYPSIDIAFRCEINNQTASITYDRTLVPAIINLIDNGIRASKVNSTNKLTVQSLISNSNSAFQICIRDYGNGFQAEHFAKLGKKPITSDYGLGVAMLLSCSSIEQLGGELSFNNNDQLGAEVNLSIPLVSEG